MSKHKRGRYDPATRAPWTSAPDIARWFADQMRKRDEAVGEVTDDLTEPDPDDVEGPWHD